MSERARPSPDEALRAQQYATEFVLRRLDTFRALFHGKLMERTPGVRGPEGREWHNVVEHCVTVARSLEALGTLLGMTDEEREDIVQVGLLHDWDKRIRKNKDAFTDAELAEADAYAKKILREHDPDGHILNATEPDGLPRLETGDATLAEHCVHFIDLSCTKEGLVTPEKRFEDLLARHKGIDYDSDHPGFWDRKAELVKQEERLFLHLIRSRGIEIPEGTRLCDVLKDAMRRGLGDNGTRKE